jgi:hypothetical protein
MQNFMISVSVVDSCMQDLQMAKGRLHDKDLGLLIVKNGHVVYESASRGLSGFLEVIGNDRTVLKGASVADRVVGKAIALLCAYVKVKAVYAVTLGIEANAVLEQHGIHHEWDGLVDDILDADRLRVCPFEKLVERISSPRVAYDKLRALCEHLKSEGQRREVRTERFISKKNEELEDSTEQR